ncbi:hypothetical protein D9M71_419620 [compost metagenome]
MLDRRIGRRDLLRQTLEQEGRTLAPELLLAAEVVADHRVVDPHSISDVAQAHGSETPCREEIQRGLQDLRACLLTALLLRYPWRTHAFVSTDPVILEAPSLA